MTARSHTRSRRNERKKAHQRVARLREANADRPARKRRPTVAQRVTRDDDR
jgi:hypothetical protein